MLLILGYCKVRQGKYLVTGGLRYVYTTGDWRISSPIHGGRIMSGLLTDFGNIWSWLIRRAEEINLFASVVVLLFGIGFRVAKPEPLKSFPEMKAALDCWIMQWACLIFVYILLVGGYASLWFNVFVVDLQTVFLFLFCVAFLRGRDFSFKSVAYPLSMAIAAFLAYNMIMNIYLGNMIVRHLWVLPASYLSSVALAFVGGAFLLRYGWIALPMFVTTTLYGIFQWPIYSSIMLHASADQADKRWFFALAVGKLLFGSLFYLFFFSPLNRYEPVHLFSSDRSTWDLVRRRIKRLSVVVAPILLALFSAWVGAVFQKTENGTGKPNVIEPVSSAPSP